MSVRAGLGTAGIRRSLLLPVLFLVSGCAQARPTPIDPRSFEARLPQARREAVPAPALAWRGATSLTLAELRAAADETNPEIAAERKEIDVSTAAIWEARLYPNPTLLLEYEDFPVGSRSNGTSRVGVSESLKTTAETAYAPTRYARVAPRIAGIVREVRASMGQDVVAGAVLAIVEAPEMGQAATTYRQAVAQLRLREKTHAQEKELTEKKISSGHDLLVATAELEEARLSASAARQHLLTLGLGADRIETLEGTEDPVSTIEVRAPFDGTILDASAVLGENAGPDKPLFSVADASRMWLSIDVYEADVTKVEKDQRVTFTMDGMPGLRFTGRITALGGSVDERTRTLRVVAEVKNPQGILREHMFGHVDIQVKPPEPKLIVPRDAVQTDGDCYFVFTSASANVFRTRPVDLGIAYQSGYEIKGGLVAGERVVTVGSFSLKSEVLRGEMGAG